MFNVKRTPLFFVFMLAACTSRPAFAQVDLTGMWAPLFHEDQVERIPGPDVGDYAGLPINDAARMRADTWDASLLTLPEHQCKPHPSTYGFRGVGMLRITAEFDEQSQSVVAYHTHIQWQEQKRTIWMDGRPHPPAYAAHTWQGFSTGRWNGDMLDVETTHLKAGWLRRNGVPASDEATITEHLARHGAYLTLTRIVDDPIYLEEPFVASSSWVFDPMLRVVAPPAGVIIEEVPGQSRAFVPHYLPGANDALPEFASRVGLPFAATRGGSETMYPEYQPTLQAPITRR
jgi:hypothetical protein